MTRSNEIKNELYTLVQLTKRNLKIFLKDKATLFFSLLAPIIVLLLYVLFLSDLQIDSVKGNIPTGLSLNEKTIKAFVDSWMISGVLSVSCITVSLGANSVMVQDRTRGILNDSLSAPVKRGVITASYFIYNFLVTIFICLFVFCICMVYLLIAGVWTMSLKNVADTIGILIMSAMSSTFITVFVCGFFKNESTLAAFNGIVSSVIGFVIGAYMPMSVMPKFVQNFTGIFPGSHSAGLFRNSIMDGALKNISKVLPKEATEQIAQSFTMTINLFGKEVGTNVMWIFVLISIVVFAGLNFVFAFKSKLLK